MNKTEVIALLKQHKNDAGVRKWHENSSSPLKSFGLGLTVLRKLAKQIGRDHDLAIKLWNTDIYDAKVVGLLIDDQKRITRTQAEEQVDNLNSSELAHVFSSCDATLAKSAFVVELVDDWVYNSDLVRRRCGYGLLYEVSKSKRRLLRMTIILRRRFDI